MAPFAAAWLMYVGFSVLMHARAFRVYAAGLLPSSEFLRDMALALAPDAMLTASRSGSAGLFIVLYATLACGALAAWCWAVRLGRQSDVRSVWWLLVGATLLAVPLLASPGLFSDDLFLYHLYGRTISAHGENPILLAPSAFQNDPHLQWVYWKHLPSSYGPIWLMLSGVLSAIAGGSINAVVLVYRTAGLALHLLTAATVWYVLRRERPRFAVAGTLFYAWNPLVLVEVAGNAHNDVLVAQFAVLLLAAIYARAWVAAAFFGACAVMVKPFAVLLLPPLALAIARQHAGRTRVVRVATAVAIGVLSLVGLSVPLWSGTRLLSNISTNPASYLYTNSIWELISEAGPAWFGVRTVAIQHPYLDYVRLALFAAGAMWILTSAWTRARVAQASLSMWVLFCLTACWVWPWYFVPAIALAAVLRGTGLAQATGLTAGGLLFWATWPPPTPQPFEWLHMWRSLVLFGPLLLTLAFAPVRAAVFSSLGVRRAVVAPPGGRVDVRLQTASS